MADLPTLPFAPVVIETSAPRRLRAVDSAREAAECLIGGWPKGRRGRAYIAGLGAMNAALGGRLDAETARAAFIAAAKEAGIFVREGR